MSPKPSLASLLRTVHRRQWLIAAALAVPWVAAVAAVASRLAGIGIAVLVALVLGAVATMISFARSRRFDTAWLARMLDASVPALEDSSALLVQPGGVLTGLQALQQQRMHARVAHMELPDLRPPWPSSAIAISWVAGGALLALAIDVGFPSPGRSSAGSVESAAARLATASNPRITDSRIMVQPPDYTGLPARVVEGLTGRAPVGSVLQWSLQVSPVPREMQLTTRDDRQFPLSLASGRWRASAALSGSMLYRVLAADLPALDPRLHRIEAIPDRAPNVRVLAPSRTLNIAVPGQRTLELVFEAADDYAVANARLVVTLAQGSGENIGVRTQTLPVSGSGPRGRRNFTRSLDLATLGMQAGDDLIAQLHVVDNRVPNAQSARSASVILRWPPPAGAESSDMEGLVQRVLPAYFRSQRQIIIDSEALLKQRAALTAENFVEKSDAIGVDQRMLRLRYGQFLGEEAEEVTRPPGAGEGSVAGARSSTDAESSLFADAHEHEESGAHDDEESAEPASEEAPAHEHAEPNVPVPAFGDAGAVAAEFGHTHDIAEAATLLDPATQKLLRAALGEMWQAELHLRQGFPDRALPFESRALDLIKQVQQADRIYLAKVGLEIPPIDEARRLTGKRDGLRDRADALGRATIGREALTALWFELGRDVEGSKDEKLELALAGADSWLLSQAQSVEVLDVVAAIDNLRRDPACGPCRHQLRAALWPLLPRPAAGVRRRDGNDSQGRAYLDALARESKS